MALCCLLNMNTVTGPTLQTIDTSLLSKEGGWHSEQKGMSWQDSSNVATVMRDPEVISALERHAAAATSTKQRDLKRFKNNGGMTEMYPLGNAFYRKVGLQKKAKGMQQVGQPIGHVIATILASFERHGQALTGVQQNADGCILMAHIFRDLWTFGATITVGIQRKGSFKTAVDIDVRVPGQLYDWGKSKQAVKQLLQHLLEPDFLLGEIYQKK